jgi:hypothetical protein
MKSKIYRYFLLFFIYNILFLFVFAFEYSTREQNESIIIQGSSYFFFDKKCYYSYVDKLINV